jgi:hypothetical protein
MIQVYRKAGKPLAKAVKSKKVQSSDSELTTEEAFERIKQVPGADAASFLHHHSNK